MDLTERIRRRQRRGGNRAVVLNYEPINPVAHVEEPTGRGPILERVLDYLDPVFEGSLPGDAYLWGPAGSGKSAIVTALFDRLGVVTVQSRTVIHTTTRAQPVELPRFVYVNAREAATEFQFYHALLDGLTGTDVPQKGVSTSELRGRLEDRLRSTPGTVVAVDHVDEPRSLSPDSVLESLADLDGPLSTVLVGRSPPGDLGIPEQTNEIEVPAYSQQVLIDILMTRGSAGLARDALGHAQARRIASWARGNAHDALSALFGAAELADSRGAERIREPDVDGGIEAVPQPCVSLGIVLTLPENRQRVLRELLAIDDTDRESVTTTTDAIAASPTVDLSSGTVKRFLYELAESGVVERVTADQPSGHGRPPSRVEPRFPTLVFERLYDLRSDQ